MLDNCAPMILKSGGTPAGPKRGRSAIRFPFFRLELVLRGRISNLRVWLFTLNADYSSELLSPKIYFLELAIQDGDGAVRTRTA
jgi:hypothetical protein